MPRTISVRGELSLDGSGWQRGLATAGKQTERFGSEALGALKGQIAAAFSIGAITAFAKEVISTVGHIKDMSEQTGITTDEVQRLSRAANNVGLQFEDVATALSRLGKARKDAALGDTGLIGTFKRFGVDYNDLQDAGLKNVDILKKMADALQGLEMNPAQREELRELFGKGGDKLAALFNELKNMKPMTIIESHQIDQVDKAQKDVRNMYEDLKAMAALRISKIAPLISGGTNAEKEAALEDLASRASFPAYLMKAFKDKFLTKHYDDPLMAEAAEQTTRFPIVHPSQKPAGAASSPEPLYGYQMYSRPIGPENYKEPDLPKLKANADSLVRVGNFLGDAPKMARIAETQLQVSRDMLQEQRTTNRLLKANNGGGDGFLNQ